MLNAVQNSKTKVADPFKIECTIYLAYDGCMSDTTSYQVGGWCFQFFPSTQPPATSSITYAQAFCGPNGSLAVGVTYKMVEKMVTIVLQVGKEN